MSHWKHSGLLRYLVYCATLGGAFDRDDWSRWAVDDATIIDHFGKWSTQALVAHVFFNFIMITRQQNQQQDAITMRLQRVVLVGSCAVYVCSAS